MVDLSENGKHQSAIDRSELLASFYRKKSAKVGNVLSQEKTDNYLKLLFLKKPDLQYMNKVSCLHLRPWDISNILWFFLFLI